MKIVIICEEDGCKNNGEIINTVTKDNMTEKDIDLFMESFGNGGEEQADFCPICGTLGVAYEE